LQDLSKENLIQIIDFYKSKVSQQELSYLILQLETNNKIKSLNDKIDSDLADKKRELENLQNHSLVLIENETKRKQKEIDAIVKKYEKTEKKINTKTEKK
jgi:hypothetical protein